MFQNMRILLDYHASGEIIPWNVHEEFRLYNIILDIFLFICHGCAYV